MLYRIELSHFRLGPILSHLRGHFDDFRKTEIRDLKFGTDTYTVHSTQCTSVHFGKKTIVTHK